MKFVVALVALVHVVLSQDTSTTAIPAFRDTNANGFNAGNMNGGANPGNLNPGNLNPGNMHPGNADGMAVNNYPMANGGGSTTVIPGVGINAAGQAAGQAAGGSVLGDGGDSSSSEEASDLDLPNGGSSVLGGVAVGEADIGSPDGGGRGGYNNGGGYNNRGGGYNNNNNNNPGYGNRGDREFNEVGDTPDNANMHVDAGMGEQVGKSSTGATAGILIAVVAVVAAGVGIGLYVVKQRRNTYSSSNV